MEKEIKIERNLPNWEKIGIYISLLVGFMTFIFYIADMKERIARLEENKINTAKLHETIIELFKEKRS